MPGLRHAGTGLEEADAYPVTSMRAQTTPSLGDVFVAAYKGAPVSGIVTPQVPRQRKRLGGAKRNRARPPKAARECQ